MKPFLVVAAVLLALSGCRAEPEPVAARSSAARPAAPASENEHWAIHDRARADIDGDGTKEELRIRAPRRFARPYPVQVVVQHADGSTSVTPLPHQPFATFWIPADVGGESGQEVFVLREAPERLFTVLTWRAGRLVPLSTPPGRPVSDDFDGRHVRAFWAEDGTLWGYRSIDRVSFHWDWVDVPATYAVRAWQWRAQGTRLRVLPQGRFCVDRDAPHDLGSC
ncbi:MAG: hypothetical protein ABWZ91_11755 [Nocardioides sp.]